MEDPYSAEYSGYSGSNASVWNNYSKYKFSGKILNYTGSPVPVGPMGFNGGCLLFAHLL